MTRDEILNMPAGRELDALVWMALNKKEPDIYSCRFVDGDYQPNAGYPVGHVSPPHYSTDIAAAWEVVEKMLRDKDGKENKYHLYRYGFGMKKLRIRWRVSWGPGWANLLPQVDADTAPLAICRAALLAVLGE